MKARNPEMRIFSGSASRSLAEKIVGYLGVSLGSSETYHFSDGNTFVRINETVRGDDIYLIQTIGRKPNDEFMELLFWVDAFKRASANSVTAIMPFFGYAKGDKKDEPRVSIRARVCADALEAAGVDRAVAMDLHSPQIQGFFHVPVDHLYAMTELCRPIQVTAGNTVVVSPDVGFAKRARAYAEFLGAAVAIGDKMRLDHRERAEVLEIIGDVEGREALIVDDFTISGVTLAEIAAALARKGARRIRACVSHCLLDGQGLSVIEDSPIEELIVTDTVDNEALETCPKIKIVTVAGLLGEALRRIHCRDSVSALFE